MSTTTIRPTSRPSVGERVRPWWLWTVTAFAFPPAGYIAHQVAGPVDGVGAALLAGVIAGALLGTGQWAVLRRRGASPRWIAATAAGFSVGLTAGAPRRLRDVAHRPRRDGHRLRDSLVGMAAEAVGFAALRRHAVSPDASPPAGCAALGRAATTSAGIKVVDRWPLFGIIRRARWSPSGRACSCRTAFVARRRRRTGPYDDRRVTGWHVAFGSGPAGRAVATELTRQGLATRVVNRSGRQVLDGVETLGGDVTDPHFAHSGNRRREHRVLLPQRPALPPVGPRVPTAATRGRRRGERSRRRLVALENLYMYGPTGGAPMTESTRTTRPAPERGPGADVRRASSRPTAPGGSRSSSDERRLRRARRHRVGDGRVRVRPRARHKARTMGRPDTLHSFSYVPDIGRNLVLLGSRPELGARSTGAPDRPVQADAAGGRAVQP